jgi:hypothetical protein
MNASPNLSYSILACGNKTENEKGISWQRGYNIYEQLIRKYGIQKIQLRLFYRKDCDRNIVIIRPSNITEESGTNCGVPLMPDLRKKK